MADWKRIHDILQSAERRIGSSGITISHTLTTPNFIELGTLLIDARHEAEAAEALIVRAIETGDPPLHAVEDMLDAKEN